MKRYLMLSASALFCTATFAQSQATPPAAGDEAAPSTMSVFQSLDTNSDGRITADEAKGNPVVANAFTKADKNGDGAITQDEFMSSFTTNRSSSAPPQSPPPPEDQ